MPESLETGQQTRQDIASVIKKVGQYAPEAYEFLNRAISRTQELYERDPRARDEAARHVTGRELLEGIRVLALEEFGFMARIVLEEWGIRRTDDFGKIVFALVEAGHMSKRDSDSLADFHDVYSFWEAFDESFRF